MEAIKVMSVIMDGAIIQHQAYGKGLSQVEYTCGIPYPQVSMVIKSMPDASV